MVLPGWLYAEDAHRPVAPISEAAPRKLRSDGRTGAWAWCPSASERPANLCLSWPLPGGRNPTRRALGGYGELTLEKARAKARDWLELIRRGIDPQVEEQRLRHAEHRRLQNTFEVVAEDFIKEKVSRERKSKEVERDFAASSSHAGRISRSLTLPLRTFVTS
jgi:hypothetical protein